MIIETIDKSLLNARWIVGIYYDGEQSHGYSIKAEMYSGKTILLGTYDSEEKVKEVMSKLKTSISRRYNYSFPKNEEVIEAWKLYEGELF